jgi:cyclopropane fatty-acyl-phospholipid synthase-like methyltransferase
MASLPQKALRVFKEEGWSGVSKRLVHYTVSNRVYKFFFPYHLADGYDAHFFSENLADSRPMAEYLAPKIVEVFGIKRLVDFGAATGHWVSALSRAGVDVIGIEGSTSAKPYLVCDPTRMRFLDLRFPLPMEQFPFSEADTVMSIEVAEHIEETYADRYIENMLSFKPNRVLMTAAIPGQGGHWHVNEQPYEYWIEKFNKRGYVLDEAGKKVVSGFCEAGLKETNLPAIMRNPKFPDHKGVWIPFWMPKNLLVFKRQ